MTCHNQLNAGNPRRVPAALAWICAAVVALAGTASAQPITDQNIADAVEDELLFDRAVPSNRIEGRVSDGVVTLTGTVNNLLARDRATRLAETVKGVRSVVNRVAVEPPDDRSDQAIRGDVEAALLNDPATDSYEVDVSVGDDVVTLSGTVQSWTEKELCATVAKGVKGVTGLDNQIEVKYEATRSDAEIRPEVEKALRWNALVDDALIDVEVTDGTVTLTGTVGSAAERRQARRAAWVAGVKSVNDAGLNVERWARDEDLRRDKYTAKSPEEIETAVKDALLFDPRVLSFNVTPSVSGSTVTLRGVVDNVKAKRAAERVARNTVGVTYVKNRLKVRPQDGLSDAEIAANIEDAFVRDPYVESFKVDVSVVDGTAYLNGTVDSYFEKWQADDLASKTNGVETVRNYLDVEYAGPVVYDPYVDDDQMYGYEWYDYQPYYTMRTDRQIEEEIRDELWWSPFVDREDVNVDVEDGVATLTGTVDTWGERTAATDNAYQGGAVWVDNDLAVK